MKVRKEYGEKLLNGENELSGELNVEKKHEGPCEKVSVKAVTEAIDFIKTKKTAGPSGVASELFVER